MKKHFNIKLTSFILILIFSPYQLSLYSNTAEINSIVEELSIKSDDIPKGFVIGKIPTGAKTVFKSNPGFLDKNAIDKVTREIYPNGDKNKVSQIHVTILAKTENIYNDDLVCYIIFYKNNLFAKEEMNKFKEYFKYNNDRTILLSADNIAIFILSNDFENFDYVKELGSKMQSRLDNLKNTQSTKNSIKK
jgi:hypothetical protein